MRVYIIGITIVGFFFCTSAQSQTLGYAQAIDHIAVACGADIQKLCKNVNLGNNRIRNCLEQHSDRVSSNCKTTYREVFVLLQKRASAQANIRKFCETDAQRISGCESARANRHNRQTIRISRAEF